MESAKHLQTVKFNVNKPEQALENAIQNHSNQTKLRKDIQLQAMSPY